MNKKILSGACAAALCVTSFAVPAMVYAAPGSVDVALTGETSAVEAGKEFTLDVDLANNPGISALAFYVDFDPEVFSFVEGDGKAWFGKDTDVDIHLVVNSDSRVIASWIDGLQDYSENGNTASITFKVNEGVKEGDYSLKLSPVDGGNFNYDFDDIALNFTPAEVKVTVAEEAVVTYTKVPAKAATCTATGNAEYYKGSDGKLYTLGADGKYTETTLAAVTTAKIAHNYVNGVCSVCGEKDPNYVAPVEVTYTKVPAKAATCTATGNIEYYKGSDGKLYTLGNKKYTETTLAEVTTDKIAHNYVNGVCTMCSEKDPNYNPVVVTYYAVNFTGEYIGSGVTVTGSRTAGSTMTVNVPVGYSATVISGSNRIATVIDGTGTFTMPAANVTVKVESYLGALSTGYKNAYIYSYDSEMNHIKTSSVRGGMTSPEGEVTVKLGSKYAGKSVTLYNGRKNTETKVDEAELNSKGEATFSVKSGKNYTLVVD